jgi:pyoverdine/dityrosine biosynthesis protein Dit1
MHALSLDPTAQRAARREHGRRPEEEVLDIVLGYRRALPGDDCGHRPCPECFAPHGSKVRAFMDAGRPIHFILPAFPAKSPNPRSVLGTLPDMAERLALDFLQGLCDRIGRVYAPGARITICSDGRVFSDLVRLRDDDVTAYTRGVEALVGDLGAESLDLFDLDEAFTAEDFDELRRLLDRHHAEPLEEIRRRVKTGAAQAHAFNGIARFLFEDRVVLEPHRSRTAVRNECKELAYRVIQRSVAWSDLIGERFPESVRLSIHPQACHSEKIGIYLIQTRDNWLTPWHGVAVEAGGRFFLMKRHQAESLGATLVYRDGRPSHFHSPFALEEQQCPALAG